MLRRHASTLQANGLRLASRVETVATLVTLAAKMATVRFTMT